MSGDYPVWGGCYPNEHAYGYAKNVYEHGESLQAEGLQQIQSFFDEEGYSYRGHSHNSRRSNYNWHDYSRGATSSPSGAFDSYSQHQYQNGSSYGHAWGSEYHDGGDALYFNNEFPGPTSNAQCYAGPNRFSPRGGQVDTPVTPCLPAPTPRSLSPSYLSTSLSPSTCVETPSRKLLILDLNGTLLFRPKPPFQPRPSRATTPRNKTTSACQPFLTTKRTVHARPYLACFREYLFHPSTKEWLDVMIWSSAQPHSVKDMLQRCFPRKPRDGDGDRETSPDESGEKHPDDRFIAVWARDTLGLSRVDYSRKSQTTKDLHKPWSQLAMPRPIGQPGQSRTLQHSAQTTLLLDDSPLKAHLQPWNHVCLREYDAEARDEDARELKALLQEQDGHISEIRPGDVQPQSLVGVLPPSATPRFDATLLAVIGVLEGVKHESNVAGWIRAGGLRGETDEEKCATRVVESDNRATEHIWGGPPSAGGMKHGRDADNSELFPPPPAKRARTRTPQAHATCLPLDDTARLRSPSPRPPAISSPLPAHSPDPGPRNSVSNTGGDHDDAKAPTAESQSLWFTHAATFENWVCRGRKALRRLEIEEEHGVTVEEEPRSEAVSSTGFPRHS